VTTHAAFVPFGLVFGNPHVGRSSWTVVRKLMSSREKSSSAGSICRRTRRPRFVGVANERWTLLNDTLGDGGKPPAQYPRGQMCPFGGHPYVR
jgi:hypothetical protein